MDDVTIDTTANAAHTVVAATADSDRSYNEEF